MKINKERLRELIKEELSYLQKEGYYDSRSWRRERIGIELGGRGSRDEKKMMKALDIVRYISDKLKENPSSLEVHVDYLKELISKDHFTKEHAKHALDKLINLPGIPELKAQFEKIDENFFKKALASAAIAGGLMAATPAYANKPITTPSATQVEQQTLKQAVNDVLDLQRETYSVNFKSFDKHINKDLKQIKLSFDNFESLEGMGKTIDYLSKDLTTLINNQQNAKEETQFKEHNIKLKAAIEKLKNYI